MVFILLPWASCFFDLLVIPSSYNFGGHFKSTYPRTSLEFWPLKAVRSSFLVSKYSSTYTLIRRWCKSTSKTLLITFLDLLFLENCVMPGGLWWTLAPLSSCFIMFILFFIINMGDILKGSHYLIIFRHEARWPFNMSFICFVPLSKSPRNHYTSPQLHLSILIGQYLDHKAFEWNYWCLWPHSTQLTLVGLGVKVSKCKLWNPLRISPCIKILQSYILVINGLCILGVQMGYQDFATHFLDEVLS